MNNNKNTNNGNGLMRDDDYEYEKDLAIKRKQNEEKRERERLEAIELKKRNEHEQEKRREQQIVMDRIELAKLKNGVIEESSSIKEEHEKYRELHGFEKVSNFWYHNKFMIVFIGFLLIVTGFIAYDSLSRVKPDLTVVMIANNGLTYRATEIEELFEKYATDENGDGKVHVSVLNCPLDKENTDQNAQLNLTKVLAQIQTSTGIIFITDTNTDQQFLDLMDTELSSKIDSSYVTSKGLSWNMKLLTEQLKYSDMPDDIYVNMRIPVKTTGDTLEEMEESYDKSLKVFKAMAEDLTAQCKETNDRGINNTPDFDTNSEKSEDTANK